MGDNDFPEIIKLMDTSPGGTMKEHIRDLQRGREIDATTIVSLRTALAAAESRCATLESYRNLYQSMQTKVDAAEREIERLNRESAEWDTAHARGFRAVDEGKPLDDCNKESTENEQHGWAVGWMERGWQKRCEEAERDRDEWKRKAESVTETRMAVATERDAAKAEVERLRAALEFYANEHHYSDGQTYYEHGQVSERTACSIADDGGARANAALTPAPPQANDAGTNGGGE